MMVSFRITTKVATSSVAMMVTDSRDIFAGAVGAAEPRRGDRGRCGDGGGSRPVRDRRRLWKRRL